MTTSIVSKNSTTSAIQVNGIDSAVFDASGITVASQNGGQLAGLRNRIINGDMRVSQRGSVNITANSVQYGGADRFFVYTASTTVTGGTIFQDASTTLGESRCAQTVSSISGTGFSLIQIGQRIEALNTKSLNSKQITISATVYQTTGSAVNCALNLTKANTLDNFNAQTGIVSQTPVSIPNATPIKLSLTVILGGTDGNTGLQVSTVFTPSGTLTSSFFYVTDFQIEVGSVVTPFEQRPYGLELMLCQRYYRPVSFASGVWANSTTAVLSVYHPGMRASPTASINGAATIVNGPTSFTQSSANVSVFSNLPDSGAYQLTNFTGATSATPALFTSGSLLLLSEL